jgi:hypothetical protein
MALMTFDAEDALAALEQLTSSETLSRAPEIHDLKSRMIRIRRSRMTEADRARATLADNSKQYASPERVKAFWSDLSEVVQRIGEMQPKRERANIAPPPNEDYDWEKTFSELEEVDRIMKTPPPQGPPPFKKRGESPKT